MRATIVCSAFRIPIFRDEAPAPDKVEEMTDPDRMIEACESDPEAYGRYLASLSNQSPRAVVASSTQIRSGVEIAHAELERLANEILASGAASDYDGALIAAIERRPDLY